MCVTKGILMKNVQEKGSNAVPFGVSTGCLTVRRVKWVQPFRPAHKLIRPQLRSFLPFRRRIHNLVVHQRRNPLPCRRSILLRRSASLHRSRTAAPGRARGLALLRNSGMPEGPLFYFLFSFFFLSFLFFRVFLRFLRDTSSSFPKKCLFCPKVARLQERVDRMDAEATELAACAIHKK